MGHKVEVNHPDFPKDTEFDIGGVMVKNGSSKTLSSEEEQAVMMRHNVATVKEALGNSSFIKLSGSKEGGDA